MKVANVTDWQTDADLLEAGAPLDIGEGRALIVKRAGIRNREFMAAVAGIDAKDEAAAMRVFAATVVVGWRGFRDADGNEVAYSAAECFEVFRACPELYDATFLFANRRANFRAEELEAEKVQLKKRPVGTNERARTAVN